MFGVESGAGCAPGESLTSAQSGIWLAQQIEPDNPVYNIAWYVELRGRVNLDRLADGVSQAVEEAECLHVRFRLDGGTPRQVRTDHRIEVTRLDLRAADDPDAAAATWMQADRARSVDLEHGPLSGQALLRVGDDRVLWYQRYHHLVIDAYGVALLSRRAGELYTAAAEREVVPDGATVRLRAADLAYRSSHMFEADRSHWLTRMADRPDPARLLPRAAAQSTSVLRSTVVLSPERSTAVRQAAQRSGIRTSRLMIAATAAYLHRATGAGDLTLGLPVTARAQECLRSAAGMVSNVLPLRVGVRPETTPAQLCSTVAMQVRDLTAHARYRGEDLAKDLGCVDGIAELVGPSINILPHLPMTFGDLSVTLNHLWLGPVNDLTVTVYDPGTGDGIRLDFEADASVCDEDELVGHEHRFLRLLDAMPAGMDRPLGAIDLTSAEERSVLLDEFGVSPREVDDLSWPAAFERQVLRSPGAVAVVCEDQQVSYADLNDSANRLANLLITRGVRPGDIIAVALQRSAELVVALLAVMKAGAAYLPLDTDHPADRIAFMLSDAGARTVITVDELADELPEVPGVASLLIDDPAILTALSVFDGSNPEIPIQLDQSAYVIYTSGSTGRPKGVIVTHHGIGSLIATATDRIGIDANSRVAQFASVGFDVTVWDLVMSLCVGGRVIIVPAERRVAGEALTSYLTGHGATHISLPPALVAALPADCQLPEGAVLMVGTETVPPDLVARWSQRLRVVAAYGLTEVTVNSTLWPAEPNWTGAIPIGVPDPNTRCYVLDSALRPVGVGVEGELYVGGRGLARGYLGRPALTAERFIADPFSGPGARMYRTGDRARWRADGNLDYLGRADQQIKIRGHRVEPAEIENVLMAHPDIAQAAVVAREDHRGVRRLVAYVVGAIDLAEDPVSPTMISATARACVADALPEHMVPSAVVVLDEPLPLTPNGKTDLKALPAPEWTALAGDAGPSTPQEHVLAGLFAEVLQLPGVGVHDSFFELGGDSIVAIQLVARARQAGLTITAREVFRQRTVAALAKVAGRTVDSARTVELEEAALPVSPLQEGFFFHARFDEQASDLYVVQEVFDLAGDVEPARLRRTLQGLLDRHPLLRAGFRQRPDGQVIQQLAGHCTLPWREIEAPESDLAGLLVTERAEGFDLARPPLIRATLIRCGQRYKLLLTLHHIIADGWSVSIMLRELLADYAGEDVSPSATDHRRYLAWLAGRDRAAADDAWRAALSGVDEPTLLIESGVGAAAGIGSASVPQAQPEQLDIALPERLTADLAAHARARGLTMSTIVHGAWGLLLGGLTGRADVVFGSTVSGRTAEIEGISSAVGLFINTIPARVCWRPDDALADVFVRLQEEQSRLLDHQHLGLADIKRNAGLAELFDTLVVFENYPRQDLPAGASVGGGAESAGVLRITGVEVFDAVHYPLALIVAPGERLGLRFKHDASRLDNAALGTLAKRFVRVLEAVAADPDQPLAQVNLLSEQERARLAELNATTRSVPQRTLASAFAEQVARTPEATAVVFEGTRLSYAELDRQAAALACRLRARGAGPEQVVAVAVPRSAELMVALLGVLKSGAAYQPVDLDYPADRVAFMLADSGARTVVTTGDAAGTLPEVAGLEPLVLEDTEDSGDVRGEQAGPDDPAYLIYTSGSTGRPKGVVVTHRAIINRLAWMQGAYRLQPDDRVLQKTPSSFDVSVWEFFWALLEGATVVFARPDGHRDPEYLAGLIRAEGITTLHFVPSMLAAFLQAMPEDGWAASLRRVFSSGEALSGELARRWRELTSRSAHGAVPLHNLYGPTEAAVDVTWFPCTGADDHAVPIGWPVWNTRLHVLDAYLRPVADGVPGELYLAGAQLARGYHGRLGLTAERFVADPFAPEPGGRMYRTGDLVRRREDGAIEYLGRTDRQVKIRGNRIELGEIESALCGQRGIGRAAVVARGNALIGYVVPDGVAPDAEELRAGLAEVLPEPMVPGAFVVLDDLPLTPSGKLDQHALPAPAAVTTSTGRAPADERERVLCEIFAAVLGLSGVNADDDFFVLGGDSITSIAVSTQSRARGLEISPRDVFEHRTPFALAATATNALEARVVPGTAEPALIGLSQEEIEHVESSTPLAVRDIWPLSPLQEGLYFHSSYDEGALDVYMSQESIGFDHRVDADRLRAACATLLARNPSLRAGFTSDGLPQPAQFIVDDPEIPLVEIDLSGLSADEQDERVADLLAADRRQRFDLAAPPLCRLLLIRLSDGRDRLVVTHHLVLWDGWSAWLFLEELFTLYQRAGDDTGLPLPGSYRDYLAWLNKQDAEAATGAWRSALAGLDEPTLVASVDHSEPVIPADFETVLSQELSDHVRARARQHGLTLNTVLNAAWGLALSSLVGRDDVVFGAAVAGRPAEVHNAGNIIGMFLNTIPTRITFVPSESVLDLLRRIQSERAALMPYEYVGLGVLQREAGYRRLFDTLFVLRTADGEDRLAAIKQRHGITDVSNVDGTHFPLTLIVTPEARLRVTLAARPDLFDSDAATAILARFTTLLERLVAGFSVRVGALERLTQEERQELVAGWESTRNPVPDDTVADMLAAQVARTPGAVALVFGERELTYAELDAEINRLARLLLERGAAPERVIALALPRSIEMVVALFAVLRTGAAYLPLDLDHPADRLKLMITDTTPLCLLSTTSVAPRLAGTGVAEVLLDEAEIVAELGGYSDAEISDAERPAFAHGTPHRLQHPAYVIYTSGSTGKPKGVVTPYRGLTNMQLNHQEAIFGPAIASAGGRRLRIAHTVSFAFDMSWEELLWLVEGHQVHVCDEELRRDAEALVAYCDAHEIDVVNVTPTYAQLLIEEGLLDGHRPPLVLLGGEAVSDTVWSRLRDTEGTYGYNLYGPTEYTINTLGASTEDSRTPTVGHPIWNTRAYVLDSALRPVPPGCPGELYIAGIGLARGYHRRPGLTAERFVADPFCAPGKVAGAVGGATGKVAGAVGGATGGRMYRTGDLVVQRQDAADPLAGTRPHLLDFLGRTDDQVKIRGYRVELGEISSVLAEHPQVAHAAVIASGSAGSRRLVGYVVCNEAVVPQLRDFLKARVPDYMVPTALVAVGTLPLTVNGKLDVKALPAPSIASPTPSRAPRTREEVTLCALFAQVLGLAEGSVGIDDNFFDLGGHSLLATRLISRTRAALSAELAIRDLFEAPTVAELVERAAAGGGPARPALVSAGRPDELPLSHAQRRLWVIQNMAETSAAYNFPLVLRLRGELDVEAWRAALADVLHRHEALRTVFGEREGVPFQRVVPADDAYPVVECLRADETEVAGIVAKAIDRPFDLATELPLRATIIEVQPDQHVVVLLLHHITTDEWSDRPFMRDLAAAYAARCTGARAEWEPLAVQYADYALWQQRLLGDPADPRSLAARQLAYWHEVLDGVPEEIELPADRSRPARPAFTGGEIEIELEPVAYQGLRKLARDTGASMFMVLHAAVAALLNRMGAGEDIPLGSPIAGRTDAALDDLVGFFVNTLVLRTDLSGDPSFAELIARVREQDLAAFSNADIPFESVVERVNPPRSFARNPLFQVMISYRGVDTDPLLGAHPRRRTGDRVELPDVRAEFEPHRATTAKFDLVFSFTEFVTSQDCAPCALPRDRNGGKISCRLEYGVELFDAETVARIAGRLNRLIAAVVADPNEPIARVDVLDEDERRLVLDDFNATDRIVAEATMPALFAQRVAEQPDAIAVVESSYAASDGSARTTTVTYAELDARANQIARLLVSRGVGQESVVGVAVPRSVDMVATIMGVLKLGAAYLPLDLAHPADRLAYLISDSAARIVVGTEMVEGKIPAVGGVSTVLLDGPEVSTELAALATSDVDRGPMSLDQAAYVIYTSGSTGRPKGVVVAHDGISSLVATAVDRMRLRADSRVLQFASIGFDVAVFELAMALCHGGSLVLIPGEARVAGTALTDFLAEQEVTHMLLPPSLVSALPAECELPAGSTLVVGTETVPPDLFERWGATVNVVAAYGLTEATVNSTLWAAEPARRGPVPIGRPDPNTRCYVLDARLRPLPPGVVGELYVSGRGLARGYLGRPGLTSERFVADPFGPPGARMYRTGDRARWRRDGNLNFLGRVDDQIKIRGFRIELGEVEAAIASHPAVSQSAVVADRQGDVVRLVGYLAGSPDVDVHLLRSHVATLLPEYMVPAILVPLDGPLPLTPNGKLDRRALPAPDWSMLTGDAPPVTREQQVLADLFGEILELSDVGIHDNFFELGGHSMSAMRLVGRIRSRFGVELTIREIFDAPTVAGIESTLDGAASTRPELRRIDVTTGESMVPIAPAQRWQWALHRQHASFDHALVLRSRGELNADALAAALDDVVARHEPLRMLFVERDGVVLRHRAPAPKLELERCADLDGRLADLAGRAPDLTGEPPLRARLLVGADGTQALLLRMHYLAVDEWSVVPLLRDLTAAYTSRLSGMRPRWEPLPLSYSDYARWALEVLGDLSDMDSRGALQLRYWREALSGLPGTLELPVDRPRRAVPSRGGAYLEFVLDEQLHTRIDQLARQTNTSMFMVLQAALAALLTGYGAGTDLPIGTMVAGRTEEKLADLVGCFFNTIVLRTDTAGDPSFAELLARVRETNLSALDRQEAPFADVAGAAGLAPTGPQVMVIHHEQARIEELEGGIGSLGAVPTGSTNAELTLSFYEPRGEGPVQGYIVYATDLFDRSTAQRLAADLRALIERVVADPRRPISAVMSIYRRKA
ncbi:MAG: amino acid adenylation domain-containing protein [Haloechinothrix sp.]